MKLYFDSKSEAWKAARRLARKYNKAYVYITPIWNGNHFGQFHVSPDRINDQSQQLTIVPEGAAIQPGTDGMLVKAGSIL